MKKALVGVMLGAFLIGCGGKGGSLAEDAEKAANAACECKDHKCTVPHIKKLNQMVIKNAKDIEKLSAEDKKRFMEAQKKGGQCQADIMMKGKAP